MNEKQIMNIEQEMLETLKDIRQTQKEMLARQAQALAKQDEALKFLKMQTEQAARISRESIGLQRQAVDRAKRISLIALPLILLCLFLIGYLVSKYHILF